MCGVPPPPTPTPTPPVTFVPTPLPADIEDEVVDGLLIPRALDFRILLLLELDF